MDRQLSVRYWYRLGKIHLILSTFPLCEEGSQEVYWSGVAARWELMFSNVVILDWSWSKSLATMPGFEWEKAWICCTRFEQEYERWERTHFCGILGLGCSLPDGQCRGRYFYAFRRLDRQLSIWYRLGKDNWILDLNFTRLDLKIREHTSWHVIYFNTCETRRDEYCSWVSEILNRRWLLELLWNNWIRCVAKARERDIATWYLQYYSNYYYYKDDYVVLVIYENICNIDLEEGRKDIVPLVL